MRRYSSFFADPGTFSCLSPINTHLTTVQYTYLSGQSTLTTTVNVTSQGVNAHSIQVRYQSSDLAFLTATSAVCHAFLEYTPICWTPRQLTLINLGRFHKHNINISQAFKCYSSYNSD